MFLMGSPMGIVFNYLFGKLYTAKNKNWKITVMVGILQLFLNAMLLQYMRDLHDGKTGLFTIGLLMPQSLVIKDIIVPKQN